MTLMDLGGMMPEERMEALASVLAEGFLYLAENGLLEDVAGKGAEAGPKESAKNRTESPCFPSEDRLSFSPARRPGGESR